MATKKAQKVVHSGMYFIQTELQDALDSWTRNHDGQEAPESVREALLLEAKASIQRVINGEDA